jgi:hypothetical protein
MRFSQTEAHASERQRRRQVVPKKGRNVHAANEATLRYVKHSLPAGKLPL